uniref:adenylate cyclase n=1 Tax=Sinocyclocheilus grahami TaxID=75366 RepID=A0A672KNL7_SINGR
MLISLSSGMTVNLASRMDSTGVSGKIQLPEETYAILNERGFAFEYRGEIYVKGISEQEVTLSPSAKGLSCTKRAYLLRAGLGSPSLGPWPAIQGGYRQF